MRVFVCLGPIEFLGLEPTPLPLHSGSAASWALRFRAAGWRCGVLFMLHSVTKFPNLHAEVTTPESATFSVPY